MIGSDPNHRPAERVDERDTMFARMARRPGGPPYEDYYARRPELRRTDDHLRSLPELGEPGGRHYDEENCRQAGEYFDRIEGIEPDGALVADWAARIRGAQDPAALFKELALTLGSVAAGVAPLEPGYVYTHKGRFDRDYGRPIELDHGCVVVFLVEMEFEAMQRAPQAEVIRESARQYYRSALVAKTMEAILQAAGHSAAAHYDAHYDLVLPPLAVRAGLGELGRNNILIADRYGSRVRIGAVSTDLLLEWDSPLSLGAYRFCELCRKCATNCPPHALSLDGPEEVRGTVKWPTNVERCYGYWRSVGTDCGICMACCPFSHPDNRFHNLVRWMVRRMPWAVRFLLWCDDLFYGRAWKPKKVPGTFSSGGP